MSDDEATPMTEDPTPAHSAAAPTKPVYDQEFFLALARPSADTCEARAEARERWNAWRRDPANEDVLVTFEGVDFRTEENVGISFSGFEFGDRACFSAASFRDGMQFSNALFGEWVSFRAATFEGNTVFNGSKFGGGAFFTNVKFGRSVHFFEAYFGDGVSFDGSTFGTLARFCESRFGDNASFFGSSFAYWMWFDGTRFGNYANFSGVIDENGVAGSSGFRNDFYEVDDRRSIAAVSHLHDSADLSRTAFMGVTFAGANFRGEVSFARRSFLRLSNFTGVRFDRPPDFDGATNLERVNFTNARVRFVPADRPWWRPDLTTNSSVAVRLRALRSQIEATKNHDFERDLYIEERKAERGIHLKRLWEALRVRRALRIMRARLGSLPRLPHVDLFAEKGAPVVAWPERRPSRRDAARPALIDAAGPAAARLGRAYRRNAVRFLAALGPFLGHCVWIAVMAVYWALSDYGRSWLRPALWLGVVVLLFHGAGPVDGITAHALSGKRAAIVVEAEKNGRGAEVAERYDEAVGLYAVANSIPFVGPLTIDGEVKRFLFCGEPARPPQAGAEAKPAPTSSPCVPLPPASLQIATISQNLLSILLVFFIGLAMRNYFRLK